mgnify:CR=1 FL=1
MLTLMVFIHQPVHGGSVSSAMRYSIRRLYVANLAAIPSRGIVVLVRCVICGFEADVNPRIAAIYGHRPHRSMNAPPQIWICDTHFSDDEAAESSER